MVGRGRALAAWLALVGGSLTVIAILYSLGRSAAFAVDWGHLWMWLESAPAERVLLGLGRTAVMALASWVLGSTLLYTLAQATRMPALIRSVEWFTLPAVRRVAERAVALSLVVSGLGASAPTVLAGPLPGTAGERWVDETVLAVDPEPDTMPRQVYVPVPAGGGGDLPLPIPSPAPAEAPATPVTAMPPPFFPPDKPAADPAPGTAPEPVVPETSPTPPAVDTHDAVEHVVRAGESLWLIAESHLEEALGRVPSDTETSRYWAHVVAANRDSIRSGNPDLIYPGEAITCPPTSEAGP